MRTINDHIVAGDETPQLKINVLDDPGQGGANHDYQTQGAYKKGDRIPIHSHLDDSIIQITGDGGTVLTLGRIRFQDGPIREVGLNGITEAALLAILIDRMRSFQSGPYACRENAIVLTHLEEALMWTQKRTRDRIQRGVEGTSQK